RLVALAPAAARSQRRFGGALLPGARVKVRWRRAREGAARVLEEATLLSSPPRPDPLERFYTTTHLLELAGAFAREGNEDPRLYRLLRRLLELAEGPRVAELARYAEAWVLRLAGLLPEPESCAACGRPLTGGTSALSPERGFTCPEHAEPGAVELSRRAVEWLAATRHTAPDALPPLPAGEHAALGAALRRLVVGFTERPLKAHGALERLRAAGGVPGDADPGGGGR
ncbi:MAG: hypothetical protein D6718_02860, partial [Acidobacteria bacterium]